MTNIAKKCLEITSLFEAEVLIQLMLWHWKHPLADDKEFVNGLLENASLALRSAAQGEQLMVDLQATDLNFIASVWYAENCAVELSDGHPEINEKRKNWLSAVQRALPSCFCDPSDLY